MPLERFPDKLSAPQISLAIRTHSYIDKRHAVIKKYTVPFFFFGFVDSRDFCSFRSQEKSARKRKNFPETVTIRRVTFPSAPHDTHQLTPCRFSSRLVRPPPVFPSKTPSHLLFAFTAARPPPAPRSTDPRRIDCCIFDRASIASPRIRASRRPRATARHPR